MKVKPKEVLLNLPAVRLFTQEGQEAEWAATLNEFLHGKVRIKYEVLGTLGGQFVALFYLQRNNEFSELREQFMVLIEEEEANLPPPQPEPTYKYCRQVPECGCGNCRDPYNGFEP